MSTRTGFGMVSLFDDFLLSADHSGWNDNTENSGTTAQLVNREDGYVELTTGTTIGNRGQITGERVWRAESGGPLVFEAGVVFITDITEKGLFVGFTNLTTIQNPIEIASAGDTLTANADDAVGFVFDEENATTDRYFLCGSDSNVDAAGNGVVPASATVTVPVAGTDQAFRVVIDTAGAASFFINGNLVFRTGTGWSNRKLTAAVSPDVNLCPTVCVETREALANTVYVDYIYSSKGRNP